MDVVQREDVPDIDDEPEEVEEMTVLSRHHLKEKCVCKLPWCMASREQHKFGQFMTSIPKGDRARCVRCVRCVRCLRGSVREAAPAAPLHRCSDPRYLAV